MKDEIKDKILEPKDYADTKYNIPYVLKLNKEEPLIFQVTGGTEV